MEFGILGVLQVLGDDRKAIDVGGAQARTVLAMLLVAATRGVSPDALMEALWPAGAPTSARGSLQSYVSRLRRALESSSVGARLVFDGGLYRLEVDADSVDVNEFRRQHRIGQQLLAAGDPGGAADALTAALDAWRGRALEEFAEHEWAIGTATRLEEERVAATEAKLRAELRLGRHHEVVAELTELAGVHPYREELSGDLALALYRCGRQAEALRVLADLRKRLSHDLGVDPSPSIRELESKILNHDEDLVGAVVERGAAVADATASSFQAQHIRGLQSTPIVGRDRELAELRRALGDAMGGHPTWVILEGDAGIGKTRLVEAIADEAFDLGVDVLWGSSYELLGSPALWLWLPSLRALAATTDRDALPGVGEVIDRLLDPSIDAEPISSPSDPRRIRLFDAVSRLIEVASRQRARMLILDDVQWADPASLEMMWFVARRNFSARLFVVVVARTGEAGSDAAAEALATISRRPGTTRIEVRGVTQTDSARIVEHATGGASTSGLVDAIYARAEGNPFFTRELARLLGSEQDLEDHGAVPLAVREVVRRRIDQLPAPTIRYLQRAAVLGRECSIASLATMADADLDDAIDHLEPAVQAGLVSQPPVDVGTVRFEHALVREVVLADLSTLRRAQLHARAAAAVEATGACMYDDAEVIADHLWQASAIIPGTRVPLALEWAADVAARRMALETAADLLERSLTLRKSLPASELDAPDELAVIRRATGLRRSLSGYARAAEEIPRAKELAREAGDYDVLVELLWTEWAAAATVCRPHVARELAAELAELAGSAVDPRLTSVSLGATGINEFQFGELSVGCSTLDRAIATRGNDGVIDASRTSSGPWGWLLEADAVAIAMQAITHELAGVADPHRASLQPIADACSEPYVRLLLVVFEGIRACLASDVDAAWVAGKQAVADGEERGFDFYLAGGRVVLGEVLIRTGSLADGVASIEAGIDGYTRAGTRTFVPWFATQASLGCTRLGELDRSASWIARARSVVAESGELWQVPAILFAESQLAAARGDDQQSVDAAAAAALDLAKANGALGLVDRLRAEM